MRIIIRDTSCLIDLRKTALLAVFLRLPFEILIPNTLFANELVSFTAKEKRALTEGGLKVVDLPGMQVARARDVIRARSAPQHSRWIRLGSGGDPFWPHPAHGRLRAAVARREQPYRGAWRVLGLRSAPRRKAFYGSTASRGTFASCGGPGCPPAETRAGWIHPALPGAHRMRGIYAGAVRPATKRGGDNGTACETAPGARPTVPALADVGYGVQRLPTDADGTSDLACIRPRYTRPFRTEP